MEMDEITDWRDQRIDAICRREGKTIEEFCLLPPNELLRIFGDRTVAYRVVARSSRKNKPAMMVDAALSDIADFVLQNYGLETKKDFVAAINGFIQQWVYANQQSFQLRDFSRLRKNNNVDTRIRHAMEDEGCTTFVELAASLDHYKYKKANWGKACRKRLKELIDADRQDLCLPELQSLS